MIVRALVFLAACALSLQAFAQVFPAKPIRLIVGYPPGGSGDFLTRLVADEMSKDLGVAVLAENRPGAGATIATELVARAPADGYTVLNSTHHTINKALYKKLGYDPDRDFAAVTRVAVGPLVIVVNNDVPIKTLKELLAFAKANPGKLFCASAGNMPSGKTGPDSDRLNRLVAEARRNREQREQGYREQALKIYPWICGRCAREFTRANVQSAHGAPPRRQSRQQSARRQQLGAAVRLLSRQRALAPARARCASRRGGAGRLARRAGDAQAVRRSRGTAEAQGQGASVSPDGGAAARPPACR